jgi:hypothetical protein
MKIHPPKERLLILLFTALLIYFALFQQESNIPLTDHLPPAAQTLFHGTPQELTENPLIHTLNQALQTPIESTLKQQAWFSHIQHQPMLIARLPHRTLGQDNSWVALLHLGHQTPWLRTRLNQTPSALTRLHNIAACPVWKIESNPSNSQAQLYIACTENLIIACHTPNPDDIKLFIHFTKY